MSLVILLGLVVGAPEVGEGESLDYDLPPPGFVWSISERNENLPRGAFSNLHLFPSPFPSDDVEDSPDDFEALPQDAWLSPREQWARKQFVRNSVGFRDVLTLCMDLGWFDKCASDGGSVMFGVGVSYSLRGALSPSRDPLRRLFGYQPPFVLPLLKSLEIRLSDRSTFEKGKRIAKLVKPWMTHEQIHALFGESEAVIWDPGEARVTYVDYGVSVDRNNHVVCREDDQAKYVRWDWLTPPKGRPGPVRNGFYTGPALWF